MSSQTDLSRWNRAGLRRMTYVDGNAPLFLERLREEFMRHFPDRWSALPAPPDIGDVEQLLPERLQFERNRKLVALYQGDRRDMAWELARTFARACHVLAAHFDAHANEAFLRTATQWEHVRRLVATIDYQPAPAASATTALVVSAKSGKKGVLPRGFQVKHAPPEGGPQVIFETFADLEIDHELNELRPSGWDRSPDVLAPGGVPQPEPPPAFSNVAMAPASSIQGVGTTPGTVQGVPRSRAARLDTLAGPEGFRIKDFLTLDPANPGLAADHAIPETWLRELRAKAIALTTFQLEPGWSDIAEWRLPRIAEEDAANVSDVTGKTIEEVKSLKLRVELVGAYLDNAVYRRTRLKDLLGPAVLLDQDSQRSIATEWQLPGKPKVDVGQVAIVFHDRANVGEAVTIADVMRRGQDDD